MLDRDLQHPEITRALRTGYPRPEGQLPAVPACHRCGYILRSGELFGACSGRSLCADCADDEWRELTAEEKLSLLGYDPCRSGSLAQQNFDQRERGL